MRFLLLSALVCYGCHSLAGYEPAAAKDASIRDTIPHIDTVYHDGTEDLTADASMDLSTDDLVDGLYSVENSVMVLDTTSAGGQCTLWTLVIAADADDCEIDLGNGDFLPDGESYVNVDDPGGIYIGSWGGNYTWGIFRFRLPEGLPTNATIRSARLKLWGHLQWPSWETTQDALVIRLEDDAGAPVVTAVDEAPESALGGAPANARPVVPKSITWPPQGGLTWTIGDYNESPDLVPMLEQLRQGHPDSSAWTNLQFWLRGLYTARSAEVLTFDYGMDDFHTPQLQIVWCVP